MYGLASVKAKHSTKLAVGLGANVLSAGTFAGSAFYNQPSVIARRICAHVFEEYHLTRNRSRENLNCSSSRVKRNRFVVALDQMFAPVATFSYTSFSLRIFMGTSNPNIRTFLSKKSRIYHTVCASRASQGNIFKYIEKI